mgnify:FL=1
MINSYSIQIKNNEKILILYIDYNYEFGIDFKKSHRHNNMKKEIKDYIKKNKIKFDGEKIALSLGGIILAILLITENPTTNDIELTYVNNNIIPKETVNIINTNQSEETVTIKDSSSIEETTNNTNEKVSNELKEKPSNKLDEKNKTTNNNRNKNTQITSKDNNETKNSETKIEEKETVANKETNENPKQEESTDTSKSETDKVTIYRTNGDVITIPLDEYLIGVVGAEMPASFPIEALKAQAVVARTYALKKIKNNAKLTDSVSTQCYKDNNQLKEMWKNSYNTYYQKIKSAVEATKNQAIYYQNDYIDAVYHSTSNGKTEDAMYVWGNSSPYLKSVDSSWDKNSTSYLKEIEKDLSNVLNILGVDVSDTSFEILSRDSSGRVEKVRFGNREFTGVEFRNLLGLRSADFDIKQIDNTLIITTRGYGHGVGLSQYGASGMAKEGYNYIEILKHYYTGVTIR